MSPKKKVKIVIKQLIIKHIRKLSIIASIIIFLTTVFLSGLTRKKVFTTIGAYELLLLPFGIYASFSYNKKSFIKVLYYFILNIAVVFFIYWMGVLSNSLKKATGIGSDAWLNFFGAVMGAVIAIGGAQFINSLQKDKKEKEKEKLSQLIVDNFLSYEIDKNLDKIRNRHILIETFEDERLPTYPKASFDFEFITTEFDKIKYEIIKYDNNVVKNIFETYRMFYLLGKGNSYSELSKKDIQLIRHCLEREGLF